MIILLTSEQVHEITNTFWDIEYTVTIDGEDITANVNDDEWHHIPDGVIVGELAELFDEDGNSVGFAMAHPALTWEDAIFLQETLEERAEFTAEVKAAPKADRSELRSAKRTALRQEARQDARRAARVKQRQEDRKAARVQYRKDLRKETRIEARLLAEKPVDD